MADALESALMAATLNPAHQAETETAPFGAVGVHFSPQWEGCRVMPPAVRLQRFMTPLHWDESCAFPSRRARSPCRCFTA
jgi:hypothetical protein